MCTPDLRFFSCGITSLGVARLYTRRPRSNGSQRKVEKVAKVQSISANLHLGMYSYIYLHNHFEWARPGINFSIYSMLKIISQPSITSLKILLRQICVVCHTEPTTLIGDNRVCHTHEVIIMHLIGALIYRSKRSRVRFALEFSLKLEFSYYKISILRLTYSISSILFRSWGGNCITIVSADNEDIKY